MSEKPLGASSGGRRASPVTFPRSTRTDSFTSWAPFGLHCRIGHISALRRGPQMEFYNIQLLRHPRQLALIVTLVGACAGESDCPKNATSCSICPSVALSCPSECSPMRARLLNEKGQCRGADATVGCRPPSDLVPANAPCVMRVSDGAIFQASSSAGFGQEGWATCSEEQLQRINFSVPDCR